MRSSLIESRPAPVANGYRPQSAFRPQRPLTPPPVASQSPAQGFAWAPSEGWLPLLLLAVAVYSVVYSVTIAITISHTGILWITTAFGLLGGLLVAKSKRFPQALLHIAACILGYWLALCATSYLAYHVSLMTILSNLHAVISNGLALTGTPESSMIFLFYLAFLCFFLGYFGAWLVYRAHLPWLVGVVYTSIMLVNLNYIGRANLSWLIVLLIGALILLIARVQLANQLSVWKNEGLYTDPVWLRALTSRFLSIASLFILLILPFSWFLPIAGEPAAGANFWNNLNNAWTNITHANFSALTNPASLFNSSDPAANFFSNRLTITGSVNLPAGQVLSYVTGSDTRGEYLEGFTFDTFDGHTWTTRTEGVKTPYPANASLPQDNREANYNQLATTVTILQPPGGTEHFIFGPAEPGSFSVPVTLLTDNTGDFTSAWTQTDPLRPNETYQVTSDVSAATPQDLSSIPFPIDQSNIWPGDPNEQTLQLYDLQIPKSISSEVRATANRWTKGAPTMYDAVLALQNHLTDPNTFAYSLNNPSVPANTDAVTWLLHTHSGYCTYYATAMTIMARELGIPARVVNGFSEGHYDTQQKAWVVDGSEAHSWVQVYFPNFGWINFDPTPGFSVKNATSPTNTVAPGATKTPTTGATNPNKHKQPDPQSTTTTNKHNSSASPIGGGFVGQNLFLTFSLLILLGSLVIFGLAIARYRGMRGQLAPAASVYARLCRVARLFGSPPESWQTPYEYTFALSKRFPQAANALHRLADLFVRERWSKPQPVVAQHETQELNTLWQQLRNTLLRSPFTKNR